MEGQSGAGAGSRSGRKGAGDIRDGGYWGRVEGEGGEVGDEGCLLQSEAAG